ncbi:MAG: GNAT family N-acetyltransferase, partial [Oscillospiraceae bacterium]
IEHLATLPKTRGRGHGKQLVEDFLKLSSKPVVLEVELPENDIARRRIGFYERLGFKFNNHEYFQPPFHSDCEPLPLRIMSYPNEISKSQQDEYFQIIKSTVYKYI